MRFTLALFAVAAYAAVTPIVVETNNDNGAVETNNDDAALGFGVEELTEAAPSDLETRDGSKHFLEVTTWKTSNCLGSKVVGYIDHYTEHCFNVAGKSFSGLKSSRIPTGCAIKLYKKPNCGELIKQYTATQNNLCYPNLSFASYALKCCRQFTCRP